jgi:hypothetical protein
MEGRSSGLVGANVATDGRNYDYSHPAGDLLIDVSKRQQYGRVGALYCLISVYRTSDDLGYMAEFEGKLQFVFNRHQRKRKGKRCYLEDRSSGLVGANVATDSLDYNHPSAGSDLAKRSFRSRMGERNCDILPAYANNDLVRMAKFDAKLRFVFNSYQGQREALR